MAAAETVGNQELIVVSLGIPLSGPGIPGAWLRLGRVETSSLPSCLCPCLFRSRKQQDPSSKESLGAGLP